MQNFPFVLIFALVAVVIVVALVLQHKAAAARRLSMRRIAASLDAKYYEKDPFGLSRGYRKRFPILARGSNRYAYNVVDNDELTIFDHHYQTSDGEHTHTHYNTFVLFECAVDLGALAVRPEHWGDKVAATFGFDDIDFESADFSKRYHVTAADRKLAYALFDPGMVDYFLDLRDIRLWASERLILATRRERLLGPFEIGRLVKDVRGMIERIPRYLSKDRSTS